MVGTGNVLREGVDRATNIDVNIKGDEGRSSLTGNNSSTFGGKAQKTLTEQLKRMVGVDVGIGALLKQSQIFTGYLGNLFAIVGALIDTILAPLAPLAFKSLAKLGAIIPKIADMAGKYIPRIVKWGEKLVNDVDAFFKQWVDKDYAGKILKGVLALVAGNIALRAILITGGTSASMLGLRRGGLVNMAVRGGGALMGRGGGLGIGAAMTGLPFVGSRLFGGGGSTPPPMLPSTTGGGVRPPVGYSRPGFIGRLRGRDGIPSNMRYNETAARWQYRSAAQGAPPGQAGQFVPFAGGQSAGGSGGRMSRIMGRLGGGGKIPILGSALAAFSGYQGGRDQGMSVGMSAGRGATTAATTFGGAKIGAAIGTAIAPGIGTAIGTVLGGLAGFATGSGVFDKLFGKKSEGFNLDIGGQIGASGYQAPFFVAEAQEYWSDQIRKDGMIIDEHALAVAVDKKMMEDEMAARGESIDSLHEWTDAEKDAINAMSATGDKLREGSEPEGSEAQYEKDYMDRLIKLQNEAFDQKMRDMGKVWDDTIQAWVDPATIVDTQGLDESQIMEDFNAAQAAADAAAAAAAQAEATEIANTKQREEALLGIEGKDWEHPSGRTFEEVFRSLQDEATLGTPEGLAEYRKERNELYRMLRELVNTALAKASSLGTIGGDSEAGFGGALDVTADPTPPEAIITQAQYTSPAAVAAMQQAAMDAYATSQQAALDAAENVPDIIVPEPQKEMVQVGEIVDQVQTLKEIWKVPTEIETWKPPPIFKDMDAGEGDEGGVGYVQSVQITMQDQSGVEVPIVIDEINNNVYKANYFSGEDPWNL